MTYLLDVNVLLAAGYRMHVHRARAETWLQQHRRGTTARTGAHDCSGPNSSLKRIESSRLATTTYLPGRVPGVSRAVFPHHMNELIYSPSQSAVIPTCHELEQQAVENGNA